MSKITFKHETTNNTSQFLIVADFHIVLSLHATEAEAIAASNGIASDSELDPMAATKYYILEILAPGESTSGTLEQVVESSNGKSMTYEETLEFFGCDGTETND